MQVRKISSDDVAATATVGARYPLDVEPGSTTFVLDNDFKVKVLTKTLVPVPLFGEYTPGIKDIEDFFSTNATSEKVIVTDGEYEGLVGYWVPGMQKESHVE